jgi:hypothetical protein
MTYHFQLASVRTEVQDYFRSCERTLTASKALTPPFSKEELELIEFYAAELSSKILMLQARKSEPVC